MELATDSQKRNRRIAVWHRLHGKLVRPPAFVYQTTALAMGINLTLALKTMTTNCEKRVDNSYPA
jgi:hypothetical protein